MAHTSPATFLVWSVASCMLGAFLVYHLWSFDRFKCLKWNHGPNSGPFKRIMIYSYVLSIPCIMAYSLGFAIIKYTEGWVYIPLAGAIVPKPYTEWHPSSRNAILPLYLLFSLGWGLEMITHLEELCFWYFLVNSSSSQENWFQSKYFRIWASGSAFALVYMLLTTILTRSDHLRMEVSVLLEKFGLRQPNILIADPQKRENVDATTVTRLTKFHELNTIRVVFRFIFCCPLMILGIDGVKPHEHRVNENMFWTDFLAIVSAFGVSAASDDEDLDEYDPPSPFANMSIWRFMRWLNTGGRSKSESEATRLVREVIKADDFNPDDFSDNFNAQAENRWLDRSKDPSGFFDNFKEASVTIDPFDVPGLMYRDILSVIKTAFQEPLADKFHFSPFKLYHQLPGSEEVVRGYSELYNSDAFIEEHDKVQRAPLDPQDTGCKLERVVAGIMTWSDGTHLANFGTAKLWPIYMMFGNLSNKCGSLLHKFFTYSADYPEKVLLATIRDKGLCPCPRCMVSKSSLDRLGLVRDMRARLDNFRVYLKDKVILARKFIYQDAQPIGGTHVNNLLKETSSVPTLNAFVTRLGDWFNPSQMLAVDLLHEFELGVWKALFYAPHSNVICISECNASEMKKLAARDYEDLLQCSIPVFEGLLDGEHDNRLMKLLFRLAQWHALAKLRLHTEVTLEQLEKVTVDIGKLMREFRDKSASDFMTYELPREQQARARRQQHAEAQRKELPEAETATTSKARSGLTTSEHKQRKLNISTYKFHALGDYVSTIKLFGTTDNYSTQTGELAHRLVKQYYALTNKRNATNQIARRYKREQKLQKIKFARKKARKGKQKDNSHYEHPHHVGFESSTRLEDLRSPPGAHHYMSDSRNHPIHLEDFLHANGHELDPAKKDFFPKLQDHLLGRLLDRPFDGDTHEMFTDEDRAQISIVNDKIYAVKTLRINYTTYDVRRDQDVINPRTDHCTVMVLSGVEAHNAHPYWYARVLGIFHADIVWFDTQRGKVRRSQSMEFLWVRWLGEEPNYRHGFKSARLPKVGFVPDTDDYAFGFLDPSQVIRACHLIPNFANGRTLELLRAPGITAARAPGETDDWANFYVMIFVDRDMFMRYLGSGIGHIHYLTSITNADEDNETEEGEDVPNIDPGSLVVTVEDEEESDDGDDEAESGDEIHNSRSDDELGPDDGEDLDEDDNGYGSIITPATEAKLAAEAEIDSGLGIQSSIYSSSSEDSMDTVRVSDSGSTLVSTDPIALPDCMTLKKPRSPSAPQLI
ncbi:hypothetical protein K435DRAFT_836569 [Dendrothele bispora CBS 962.96]|uniref:Uncharacterized protein n=1 Tax=Dendrothele bispora (strain CBS 962.96) TaxID=1314807 RepID=A0A4S8MHQ7_DENBC|nr:hypothetical protein K435DRAFT_836569 [Dendrothele bispora CBS 962.96]